MLNKSTLEQSVPLAQKFAASEYALLPVEGTPLDHITATCSLNGLFVDGKMLEDYSLSEVIDYLSAKTAAPREDGTNEHGYVNSSFVQLAARGVQAALNVTRNVVVPDIKDVLKKIEDLRAGFAANSLDPFVVVPSIRPILYSEPQLYELVERFSQTAAREIPRRQLPGLGLDVLREKIKTGWAGFDEMVEAALGDDGLTWVGEVFSGNIELGFLNPDYAIGLHLLCKNLYDEPPEGVRLSLNEYNNHLSLLIEQTGRIALQVIETSARRKKLGLLYVSAGVTNDDGFREIHVDNEAYLKLVDQGLTPETLFGNELLGRRYQSTELVAAKEELTAVYNREMRLRASKLQIEIAAKMRTYVDKVITLMINERKDEDLVADRAVLHQRLAKCLEGLSDRELDNLPMLCRNVVCHVFYAHTDAKRILSIMDRLGEKNPDVDPREVALLATIEYVATWVASQIRAER